MEKSKEKKCYENRFKYSIWWIITQEKMVSEVQVMSVTNGKMAQVKKHRGGGIFLVIHDPNVLNSMLQ